MNFFSVIPSKNRSESPFVVEGNHNTFADIVNTAKQQGQEQTKNIGFVHYFVHVSFLEAVASKVIKNFFLFLWEIENCT